MTTARRSLATALMRARSRAASLPPSYTTRRDTTPTEFAVWENAEWPDPQW